MIDKRTNVKKLLALRETVILSGEASSIMSIGHPPQAKHSFRLLPQEYLFHFWEILWNDVEERAQSLAPGDFSIPALNCYFCDYE